MNTFLHKLQYYFKVGRHKAQSAEQIQKIHVNVNKTVILFPAGVKETWCLDNVH